MTKKFTQTNGKNGKNERKNKMIKKGQKMRQIPRKERNGEKFCENYKTKSGHKSTKKKKGIFFKKSSKKK